MHTRRCTAFVTILLAVTGGWSAGRGWFVAPSPLSANRPAVSAPSPPAQRRAEGRVPFGFVVPTVPKPFDPDQLHEWAGLVNLHDPGADDVAARTVVKWNDRKLSAVFYDLMAVRGAFERREKALERARELPPEQAQAARARLNTAELKDWEGTYFDLAKIMGLRSEADALARFRQLFERAAVLHTDVALFDLDRRSQVDAAVVVDLASLHFGFALALVERLGPGAGGQDDGFARLWYTAVTTVLRVQRDIGAGPLLVERAVVVVPGEPRLYFAGGVLNEFLASSWVQSPLGLRHDVRLRDLHVADEATYLKRAEQCYRQVIAIDPSSGESRLRAAHVAGLRGEHRQALAELRALLPDVPRGGMEYLAWLFIGREQEALGDCGGATASYRHALATKPRAQAATMALSHALWLCGDRQAAAAVIGEVLDGPDVNDPWGDYYSAGTADLPEVLDRLRSAARKGTS